MNDTPNTDRERFEQFHGQRRSKGAGWRERMFDRLPDGTYADDSVQRHWWTWQNALEAQAAELARLRAERVTGMDAFVLRLLVAAGHVTQAKVDEAFSIAEKAPQPPAQPAPTRSQKLAEAGFARRPSLWAMQARETLELIAAPIRRDGTWNRDRAACQQLAAEALGRYGDDQAQPAPPSAVERDAVRYRWLRGGPDVPQHSLRWPRWEVRHWDGRFWNTMFAGKIDTGIDRDAAIDAAAGKGEAS